MIDKNGAKQIRMPSVLWHKHCAVQHQQSKYYLSRRITSRTGVPCKFSSTSRLGGNARFPIFSSATLRIFHARVFCSIYSNIEHTSTFFSYGIYFIYLSVCSERTFFVLWKRIVFLKWSGFWNSNVQCDFCNLRPLFRCLVRLHFFKSV